MVEYEAAYASSTDGGIWVEILVLGAGPGGISAALEALRHGHRVTIIDPEGLGGNALKHSLVPSKVLIQAADVERKMADWGVGSLSHGEDWTRLMAWQKERVQAGIHAAAVQLQRARIIEEAADWLSPREVVTAKSHTVLQGDVVIIAVGSRQRLIPGLKPDGSRVLLPRALGTMTALPDALTIIGAGATGLEAASLFSQFGASVEVYVASDALLPNWDVGLGTGLLDALQRRGVTWHFGRRVVDLSDAGETAVRIQWRSPAGDGEAVRPSVLLATGRIPVWDAAILQPLGFALDPLGFFAVSSVGETSVDGVYAVGDAAAGLKLASRAWMQGQSAVRHALGIPTKTAASMVEAIFTHPEVARVGVPTDRRYRLAPNHSGLYHALLQGEEKAYGVIYADDKDGIKGAEFMGSGAAEAASLVSLAIDAGLSADALAAVGAASPTSAEWFWTLSRERTF